jgi:CheY-like chemotaxis protein
MTLQGSASLQSLADRIDSPASSSTQPEPQSELPIRILLAEDNPVNQKVAIRMLQKRGYSVEIAATGRHALEAFQTHPFDILLMDVQMPEMDGLEATKAIREIEAATGKHIPIIALTAHAMSGDRDRCLAAGMDGYASKPLRIEDLEREIQRLLHSDLIPVDVNSPAVSR